VSSGVYHETLDIDKPLSLIGEDRENTFIIGSGIGSVVHVSSDNVTLRGFTVKGSGHHYISPFLPLLLECSIINPSGISKFN